MDFLTTWEQLVVAARENRKSKITFLHSHEFVQLMGSELTYCLEEFSRNWEIVIGEVLVLSKITLRWGSPGVLGKQILCSDG